MTEPLSDELEALRAWLTAFDEHCRTAPLPQTTHLVVTPLGWPDRALIEEALHRHHLSVLSRLRLRGWPRLSTVLQVTKRTDEALRRAVVFEATWAAVDALEQAEAWELSLDDAARLVPHKRALRAALRSRGVEVAELPRRSTLHALHLADADDFTSSSRRLVVANALLEEGLCGELE